jgi:hypothetical protein
MRELVYTKLPPEIKKKKKIERDIINVHTCMSSCNVPVIINKFPLKFNFLNRFFKNSQIFISKYLAIG